MKLVVLESPYAGKGTTEEEMDADALRKFRYLQACLYDCYLRGESPYASHIIGPFALDDDDPVERELGIKAGFPWRRAAHASVFYVDLGESTGMKYGREDAELLSKATNHEVKTRRLGPDWERQVPLGTSRHPVLKALAQSNLGRGVHAMRQTPSEVDA